MRKFFWLFMALCCHAVAADFPGNAEKGKALFEKGNCHACHSSMVGGNGNGIFTRPGRKVHSPAQLIEQLHSCSTNSGANWSEDDIAQVAAYLNRDFYKFR